MDSPLFYYLSLLELVFLTISVKHHYVNHFSAHFLLCFSLLRSLFLSMLSLSRHRLLSLDLFLSVCLSFFLYPSSFIYLTPYISFLSFLYPSLHIPLSFSLSLSLSVTLHYPTQRGLPRPSGVSATAALALAQSCLDPSDPSNTPEMEEASRLIGATLCWTIPIL